MKRRVHGPPIAAEGLEQHRGPAFKRRVIGQGTIVAKRGIYEVLELDSASRSEIAKTREFVFF